LLVGRLFAVSNSKLSRIAVTAVVAAWLLLAGFLALLADGYVPRTTWHLLLALLLLGPLLLFGQLLFEALFGTVAYSVGRVLLPFATFGTVRAEAKHESLPFSWLGVHRRKEGPHIASAELTMVFGLVVMALVVIGLFVIYRLARP
jgi:hypothetical protein